MTREGELGAATEMAPDAVECVFTVQKMRSEKFLLRDGACFKFAMPSEQAVEVSG